MKHVFVSLILATVCWQLAILLDPKRRDMMLIYYNDEDEPVPMLTNISQVSPTLKTQILRFGLLPCSCEDYTCGCCANMNIRLFNFQRHACMNMTYDPYEFSLNMNMLMNEESIYQQSVSAKNPPPACLQIPMPYIPTIDFCVRLFDIFTPDGRLHMCLNFETRIERVPVMVLQFDCLEMGTDGVSLIKPEEAGETTLAPEKEDIDLASDVYDEVNEIKKNGSFVNKTTNSSSEETKNITTERNQNISSVESTVLLEASNIFPMKEINKNISPEMNLNNRNNSVEVNVIKAVNENVSSTVKNEFKNNNSFTTL